MRACGFSSLCGVRFPLSRYSVHRRTLPPRSHRDDVRWAEETSPDRQPRADTRVLHLVGGGGHLLSACCRLWVHSVTQEWVLEADVLLLGGGVHHPDPGQCDSLCRGPEPGHSGSDPSSPPRLVGPSLSPTPRPLPITRPGGGGPSEAAWSPAPPDLQVPAERSSPGGWAPLISHCTWLFPSRADG